MHIFGGTGFQAETIAINNLTINNHYQEEKEEKPTIQTTKKLGDHTTNIGPQSHQHPQA